MVKEKLMYRTYDKANKIVIS